MLTLLALLLALGDTPKQPWEGPPLVLRGALVEEVHVGSAGSGFFAVWNRIHVLKADGQPMDLFSLHMGDEALPKVGERCDFDYHLGRLGGSIGDGLKNDADWPMVDSFHCG